MTSSLDPSFPLFIEGVADHVFSFLFDWEQGSTSKGEDHEIDLSAVTNLRLTCKGIDQAYLQWGGHERLYVQWGGHERLYRGLDKEWAWKRKQSVKLKEARDSRQGPHTIGMLGFETKHETRCRQVYA
jgi:hypothetical protein